MSNAKLAFWSRSSWVAVAIMAGLPAVPAVAQIQEIIVETRRRAESLQDVPIAVSAITTEQIERQGISSLQDIVQNQPSVQFDQAYGPSDNRVTIRGLSNTRGRSNVAFLVDGIDVTTENLIAAGSGLLANRRLLTDIERVEIVKGPQSALYGRSAFAGAISYITREPGDEFNGRVSLDIGDYGRRIIEGAFGGPLTDTFGIRLTGVTFNEDGYYQNSMSGEDVGGSHGYGGAFTAVWRPDDAVKIKGRLEYSKENYDPRAVARIAGDKDYELPPEAVAIPRPIITGDPATQPTSSTGTNLYNFGSYCPGTRGWDPSNITGTPSFCLPGVIKSADGLSIRHSENPRTGRDYPGTETETFRASLIATFDLGYALLSSYTGWTDFEGLDHYDQDYQASAGLDFNGNGQIPYAYGADGYAISGRRDTLMGAQEAHAQNLTKQFSQEFRFSTELDGPFKFTGGVLFWQDRRQVYDRNWITFCAPYRRDPATIETFAPGIPDPTTGLLEYVTGVCDGTAGTDFNYQDYRRRANYSYGEAGQPGGGDYPFSAIWDARTRHLSFYGLVEWALTDDLMLSFETRFVDEEFSMTKPAASNCTEAGFAAGGATRSDWRPQGGVVWCDAERMLMNIPPLGILPPTFQLPWRYLEGSTYSNYNTPKVTLDWSPLDNTTFYFHYAFGQKPGGINQLTGGGSVPALESERFDPEKLKAWEIGMKTSFEAAGFWQLNSSVFLQDYTDKQISVQTVDPQGVAQPMVVNASGAEVWGLEFDLVWQPNFMDGLSLMFAATILDAKYTDWVDDTRNLVKVAEYGECPLIWIGPGAENGTSDPNSPTASDPLSQAYCRLDYSNNDLERTPTQSYAASVRVQRPFLDTAFEYVIEVDGSWQNERWAEAENLVKMASYGLVDLRLGLTADRWTVLAYIDNVFDDSRIKTSGSGPDFGEQVTQLGFTAGFGTTHYFATLPDPRVFGIRAAYNFGGGR